MHLDTWHGTLTFFKNRKCIGEGGWDPGGAGGTCARRKWRLGPKLSGPKDSRKAVLEERSLRVPGSPESGTAQGPSPQLLEGVQVAGLPRSPGFRLSPPPGVAATKLRNRKFYPMVCSTAAKSSMKVIRSCASATSLQYLCCHRLRQLRPDSGDTLEGLPLPPGLKQVLHHKLGWVLSMSCGRHKSPVPSPKPTASPSSPESRRCQRKRCRRT